MRTKYTYDESGVTFFYYALTILCMVVTPATLYLLGKKGKSSTIKPKTKKIRTRKPKAKSVAPKIKFALVVLGWILIFFLAYKVKTTEVEEAEIWDPFKVLGVDAGEDIAVIKRSYRKLSIKWHPDKVSEDMKEEAGVRMAEINRAYHTLTDETARENYEKYGNPDGMQTRSMGIALPKLLVEAHTSPFVLMLYCLVFGFIMPFYVGRWWYNSTRYQKDGILNPTMGTFFKNIREHISQRNLIELITAASEFSEDDLKYKPSEEKELSALLEKVQLVARHQAQEVISSSKKFTSKDAWKANILLHAHFFRVPVSNIDIADQQQQVVMTSLTLVHRGLLQISTAHNWYNCSMLLMNISQMLVQGLYVYDAPLMQLPGITFEKQQKAYKEKDLYGVKQLLRLSDSEQRQALEVLGDKQFEEALQVAKFIPNITAPRVIVTVIGDKTITPLSIVTLIIKIKIENAPGKATQLKNRKVPDIEEISDEDTGAIEEFVAKNPKKPVQEIAPEAYCPYFAGRKESQWWVVFANFMSGKLVVPPIRVSNLATERTVSVQFQAPPQKGTYSFHLLVKSDSYIGCDILQDIRMVVADKSSLPPEPVIEDDISEPEDDSISAQMAQLRGQQRASNKDDDSSDEE